MGPKTTRMTFDTVQELIREYLTQYYTARDLEPLLRQDIKAHYSVAEEINNSYLNNLSLYPQWVNEKSQQALRNLIDYMTGVFTRHEEVVSRPERIKAAPVERVPEKKPSRIIAW